MLMKRLTDLVLKGVDQASPVELIVTLHEEVPTDELAGTTTLFRQETSLTERKMTRALFNDPEGTEATNPTLTGRPPGFRASQEAEALPLTTLSTREASSRFHEPLRDEKLPTLRIQPEGTGLEPASTEMKKL